MSLKGSYDTLQPSVIQFNNVDISNLAQVAAWTPTQTGFVTVTCTFSIDAQCSADGVKCTVTTANPDPQQAPIVIASVVASIPDADAGNGSSSFVVEAAPGLAITVSLTAGAAGVNSTGIVKISYL
jgi:hypothetical protein